MLWKNKTFYKAPNK